VRRRHFFWECQDDSAKSFGKAEAGYWAGYSRSITATDLTSHHSGSAPAACSEPTSHQKSLAQPHHHHGPTSRRSGFRLSQLGEPHLKYLRVSKSAICTCTGFSRRGPPCWLGTPCGSVELDLPLPVPRAIWRELPQARSKHLWTL
jgi:hypothetical protein